MPPKIKDRIGQKYNKLTVIKFAGQTWNRYSLWLCKCDCGNKVIVRSDALGITRSCGCLYKGRKGEKASNYKNGKYCGRASLELKEKIRKRDNHTCQHCGKTQKEHIKETNRILDVHHINGDDTNNAEENMVTLCKDCHRKTRKELKQERGKGINHEAIQFRCDKRQ